MDATLIGCAYVMAVACAMLFTPLSIRLARSIGGLDLPHARKVHADPTPRLGGLAIAASVVLPAVLLLGTLALWDRGPDAQLLKRTGVLMLAALAVLGLGVADDVWTLKPKHKLLVLLAAAAAVCGTGIRIDQVGSQGHVLWALGGWSWPVTMLWLVGVTVCVNFIDGLDGLAAGITAIAAAVLAIVVTFSAAPATSILVLALLGSLTGFLFFNFNPARVFMGDGGAMFIGFLLAGACVLAIPHAGTARGVFLPALALSVPLIDGAWTLLRRKVLQRRSLFAAERGHIHHQLLNLGLCQRHAVLVLYGTSIAAAGVGLISLLDNQYATIGGLVLLVPLLVGVFRGAGSLRVRETVAAVRRNRALGKGSREDRQAFEEVQLGFAVARDFGSWWTQVCAAARSLGFLRVQLVVTNRDGSESSYLWERPGQEGPADAFDHHGLRAKVPIRQRRGRTPLEADVLLPLDPCLETAGRRLALFTRLMEEYSLSDLPGMLPAVRGRAKPARARHSTGRASFPGNSQNGSAHGHASTNGHRGSVNGSLNGSAHGHALSPAADGQGHEQSGPTPEDQDPVPSDGHDRAPAPSQPAAIPLPPGPNQDRLAGITSSLRVAVVHDFLYTYAGAERVLEQILNLFPDADLFSLFDFLPEGERGFIRDKTVRTSFIQRLPLARKKHRAYLPIMPLAIEQMDVSGYDLVISSSYLAAKGVITRPDTLHVCYCHTPVRYAWDLQHQYLGSSGMRLGVKSLLARSVLHYLRGWDARSANGVDRFIANSAFVGRRIRKTYRRDSAVVHPPVDVERFTPGEEKGVFYVTASRLVQYKRIDAIVEAFNQMPQRQLIVIGEGPDLAKLRAAAGDNIKFVGHQPLERMRVYIQMARAFVFAAEEDFGIVPVEAQACGTPVIAFGRGGVTESVLADRTGLFFDQQTPDAIRDAVERFEAAGDRWESAVIRENAERYSPHQFRERFAGVVLEGWESFHKQGRADGDAPTATEDKKPGWAEAPPRPPETPQARVA